MPSSRDEPTLKMEADGAVLLITISRPHVRNAIDDGVARLLADALDRLDGDPELRVGIITGSGGNFCSGMDLAAFASNSEPTGSGAPELWRVLRQGSAKPLLAAVEGWAVAAGFELVLACDIVVAASDAHFALPEVRRGLVPAGGAVVRLPRRIAEPVALEMIMTGSPIDAARAHGLGLVNVITEPGCAVAAAHEVAARIARNAPLAVYEAKRAVRDQWAWDESTAWTRQMQIGARVMASADAKEGAEAFLTRREPKWLGR